jgi:hypothetical protein
VSGSGKASVSYAEWAGGDGVGPKVRIGWVVSELVNVILTAPRETPDL